MESIPTLEECNMSRSRRFFLNGMSAGALGAVLTNCAATESKNTMKAGFGRVKITPPIGTAMTGFGFRDYDPTGCKGIHDDLYARALYLNDGREDILIMGFDLLFFSRDEANRYKGAIGRKLDLSPRQILLNTSHTHTGPKVGSWDYTPSDRLYLQFLENAIVNAAVESKNTLRDVTLWAGETHSKLPMSRRKPLPNGIIDFAPYPEGVVYDKLPFCLFKDMGGKPVYLLFSVSTHPSTIKGNERSYFISADYPGKAMAVLDEYLGAAGSLFLQGAAGDSKPSVIGKGEESWRAGDWPDVDSAGSMAAYEVINAIDAGLTRCEPELSAVSIEMSWPMAQPRTRAEYVQVIEKPPAHSESIPEGMKRWAQEMIELIDRGFGLPTAVPITAHGVRLGKNLRLVGIEGEIVAELGHLIANFYGNGITFPMGYTDGAQLYLPTSKMLDEGGYEAESYYEYRFPAPLAKGMEGILTQSLQELRTKGIT